MPKITYKYITPNNRINDFRYLWMKTVTGFNPKVHCARCLQGKYSRKFSPKMTANQLIEEEYPLGEILYFCGVSSPYRWENNMHFAGKVAPADIVNTISLYNGDTLEVTGVEEILFDNQKAIQKHANLGANFITCRNFQFGSQFFE